MTIYQSLSDVVADTITEHKSVIEFFLFLKKQSYTRLEMMIIDSVIKKMPLENLHNTLLLTQSDYTELIKSLTKKLKSLKSK